MSSDFEHKRICRRLPAGTRTRRLQRAKAAARRRPGRRVILDGLYEAIGALSEFTSLEASVPKLLAALAKVTTLLSVVIVEAHTAQATVHIWHGAHRDPTELALIRVLAEAALTYFGGPSKAALGQLQPQTKPLAELMSGRSGHAGSLVTLPLSTNREPVFGILQLECQGADEADLALMSSVANHLALAMERGFRAAAAAAFYQAKHTARLEREGSLRFRALTELIPQLVWIASLDGDITYVNRRWLVYTGLSEAESLGTGWQVAIHPDDAAATVAGWMAAVRTGGPYSQEYRLRARDGTFRWHLCRAMNELDADGQTLRWLGTSTDIHAQKELVGELLEAKQRADSANVAKSAFLTNMSHEIRTPLAAIVGLTDLLLIDDVGESERRQCIEVVNRNGRELAQLVGDILDLAKIEADRLEVEHVRFSLPDFLRELIATLGPRARWKGLALTVESEGPMPPFLISDPERLRQILVNMIGNALKFTAQGGVKVKVRHLPTSPARIEFAVEDTGLGIEAQAQERLFQPFVQADNSVTRRFGGTGLGLALSRRLAAALGGAVSLKGSAPGVGSTFVVTVASGLGRDELAAVPSAVGCQPITAALPAGRPRLSGLRVLVADDVADNRFFLQHLLRGQGASVDLAEDGAAAVTKACMDDFDVVLMDIQMPNVDGHEATRQLRRRGYRRPIIALTAHAMAHDRAQSLNVGCNEHLTKPVDRHLLFDLLQRYRRGGSASMQFS